MPSGIDGIYADLKWARLASVKGARLALGRFHPALSVRTEELACESPAMPWERPDLAATRMVTGEQREISSAVMAQIAPPPERPITKEANQQQ